MKPNSPRQAMASFSLTISGEVKKRCPVMKRTPSRRRRCRCMRWWEKNRTSGNPLHQPHPLISGMGSSSAALLTGMLGANALLGETAGTPGYPQPSDRERRPPGTNVFRPCWRASGNGAERRQDRLAQAGGQSHDDTVVLPDFYFPTKAARRDPAELRAAAGCHLQCQPGGAGDQGAGDG